MNILLSSKQKKKSGYGPPSRFYSLQYDALVIWTMGTSSEIIIWHEWIMVYTPEIGDLIILWSVDIKSQDKREVSKVISRF